MRRTACITVVAGLVVGGVLTGCGAGSGPSAAGTPVAHATPTVSPLHIVQAAYTKTVDVGSVQFAMNGTFSSTGMDMRLSATGAEDFSGQQAEVTLTMPVIGEIQMRLIGGTVYVQSATSNGSANAGKWFKVNAPDAGEISSGSGGFDAKEGLTILRTLSTTGVIERGSAEVRGVPTTHYSATLDLTKIAAVDKAVGNAGTSGADTDEDLGSMLKGIGMTTAPVDLYLDAQGRLRRMSLSVTAQAPTATPTTGASSSTNDSSLLGMAGAMNGSFTMSMDFFNFGVPVHVSAPPADQISTDPNRSFSVPGAIIPN